MKKLSSEERILRTIAGQPVDRIPIFAPLGWNPLQPEPDPDDWKAQPNHKQLIPLVSENCDFYVTLPIPERVSIGNLKENGSQHGMPTGIFDRRFFLIPPDYIEVLETGVRNGNKYTHYKVHTPKGDLTTTDTIVRGVDTVWTVEPLIKDVDDVEKILSVPYRFDLPDLSDFFAVRDKLGDRGMMVCFVSSPLVMVSRLMEFQKFFEWTLTERPMVERMIRIAHERVAERLQHVLERGVGPIIRFGGCEQATPPMMSPRFFDEFIIKYEGPLWTTVRDAGKILWVHCHGKISTVIDRFVDMGVQLLDPVEPHPQGDIEIAEAKKRAAVGPMTLIGNVEMSTLETCSVDQVEMEVRKAICEGGRKHLILGASDIALSAISDRLRENITRYIESGIKYGTFSSDASCAGENANRGKSNTRHKFVIG